MTSLYNCKHAGDQYRITKFDQHMNVEASYLCTTKECECPAGHRPRCRHREMLPRFIQRGTVGTEWCYDFDRGGWVQTDLQPALENITATEVDERIATMNGPANPIVEHLVDKTLELVQALPPTTKRSWRRF